MADPFYLKGLDDSETRFELSEGRILHICMIISLVKEGNKAMAIKLAGTEKQLNQIILSSFYQEYYRLKEAFEIHKNSNNHWLKWGHKCYSDFEQYAQETLPKFELVIDKMSDEDFIDMAVKLI